MNLAVPRSKSALNMKVEVKKSLLLQKMSEGSLPFKALKDEQRFTRSDWRDCQKCKKFGKPGKTLLVH